MEPDYQAVVIVMGVYLLVIIIFMMVLKRYRSNNYRALWSNDFSYKRTVKHYRALGPDEEVPPGAEILSPEELNKMINGPRVRTEYDPNTGMWSSTTIRVTPAKKKTP